MKRPFWQCPKCGLMFVGEEGAGSHQRWWVHFADWRKLRRLMIVLLVALILLALLGTCEPESCAYRDPYEHGGWVDRECTWGDTFWGKILP